MTELAAVDAERDIMLLEPDFAAARAFFNAIFANSSNGAVHFRGALEGTEQNGAQNFYYPLDQNFYENVDRFLRFCADEHRAAFFLPGLVDGHGARKENVLSLAAVLVDLDKGSPSAKLAIIEQLVGPATVVVESGGMVNQEPKLHAYFRLQKPAAGEAEIQAVGRINRRLAEIVKDDKSFGQRAQLIRAGGSIHFKGDPKLVRLRKVADVEYALPDIESLVGVNGGPSNPFDFGNVSPLPGVSMERILTQPVHEGAVDEITRYGAFTKAAGHHINLIRDPVTRWSREQAWDAIRNWNAVNLAPAWPEDRLQREFEALLKVDAKNHGPLPAAPMPAHEWARFDDWSGATFLGEPPKRKYLIEGVLPLGIPAALCASGGTGKSYLMLDLALRIATGGSTMAMDFNNKLILGGDVCEFGTAVVFFAEDDKVTIHERLNALDPAQKRAIAKGRLRPIPLPNIGGSRPLFVEGKGGYSTTPEFELIRAWLKNLPDLKLVCFDPLQTTAAIDITAKPEAGQFVMSALSALAAELSATVLVTHHLKKTDKPITGPDEARAAIRGTTALVDGVRWVYAIWKTGRAAAGDDIVAEGAVVKTNGASDERVHQYRRLACGVLRQVPPSYSPDARARLLDELAAAIASAADGGRPFTMTGPNGLFLQQHRLPASFHKSTRALLEGLGQDLLGAARVVKGVARGAQKRVWLDRPEGAFAMGHGVIEPSAESAAA